MDNLLQLNVDIGNIVVSDGGTVDAGMITGSMIRKALAVSGSSKQPDSYDGIQK